MRQWLLAEWFGGDTGTHNVKQRAELSGTAEIAAELVRLKVDIVVAHREPRLPSRQSMQHRSSRSPSG